MGKYGQLEEDEIEMLRKLEITKEEMELFLRYTIDVLIDLPREKWPLAVVMAPKDRIKEARELQLNAALKGGISKEESREYTRLLSSPALNGYHCTRSLIWGIFWEHMFPGGPAC